MSKNTETVRRFVEDFLGRGDLGVADETAHEKIQGITGLKPGGPIDGREEYRQNIAGFVASFAAESPLRILDQFESADGRASSPAFSRASVTPERSLAWRRRTARSSSTGRTSRGCSTGASSRTSCRPPTSSSRG